MAFVNELIKNEDVRRYLLAKLVKFYNPYTLITDESDCVADWTVDRERESYLLRYRTDRETLQTEWLLVIKGVTYTVGLEEPRMVDYEICWSLTYLGIPDDSPLTREQVIDYLKEALTVFNWNGVSSGKSLFEKIEFTF